jgi:aminoglycoside 3-N-acetyltransferase
MTQHPGPRRPYAPAEVAYQLTQLGLRPGMCVMLHCSLRALGWVLGGPAGLYAALAQVVNCDGADSAQPQGTVLMPTFDRNNTEPSNWKEPPLEAHWWPLIRSQTPPYDPATSPSIAMGVLAEYLRTLPGTLRSPHPHVSWCGRGAQAAALLREHPLDYPLGEASPLGRSYAAAGWVLSLGTAATTVLHLAEHRCEWAGKGVVRQGSAMLVNGQRQWVEYDMLVDQNHDFAALRSDYMQEHAAQRGVDWQQGPCANGSAQLLAVRPLVDYAAHWLAQHRR